SDLRTLAAGPPGIFKVACASRNRRPRGDGVDSLSAWTGGAYLIAEHRRCWHKLSEPRRSAAYIGSNFDRAPGWDSRDARSRVAEAMARDGGSPALRVDISCTGERGYGGPLFDDGGAGDSGAVRGGRPSTGKRVQNGFAKNADRRG